MLQLFFTFELQRTLKYFKTKTLAKLITSALFFLVFLFVATGIYFFFVNGFRFINVEATDDIRLALTIFIYEIFSLVLAGVIVLSSVVSGIFNLFRSTNNNWLISSPGFVLFPKFILIRSIVASALPSSIVFIPAVMAFSHVNHLGIVSVLFILLSVLLLIVALSSMTLLIVLLITTIYYNLSKKIRSLPFDFKGLVELLTVTTVSFIFLLWRTIADIDIVQLFKAENVDTAITAATISDHFMMLPTHPFAMEIMSWQNNDQLTALTYCLLLSILAAGSVALFWYSAPMYYVLWQKFQEGNTRGLTPSAHNNTTRTVYHFTGGRTLALFKKEALVSSRNFKGILWLLFLFGIWFAQIATNVILGHNISRYAADISSRTIILDAIQSIIALYFISSFALRFVFPSFSMEKKTSWILGSSPLSFTKIFIGKYLFYTATFVVIGLLMSSVNAGVLSLSLVSASYTTILFVVTTITIVTGGLSLGALFPNTETDDPEVISTSMPGLFFTAFSLIYGTVSAWILYSSITSSSIIPTVLFIIISLLVSVLLVFVTPSIVKKKQQ